MDPLLSGDIGWVEVAIVLFKVVVAFAGLMVGGHAHGLVRAQARRRHAEPPRTRTGPDRSGSSRRWRTASSSSSRRTSSRSESDPFVFKLAPYLSLVPAFLTFAVIPIAGNFSGDNDGVVTMFGQETLMQVADPQIGILLVLAMSSVAVYGVMLAGWSSGSKYPLLGSVRASAQMVSYEAALGLSVATDPAHLGVAVDQRDRRHPVGLELEPLDDRVRAVHRVH